MARTARRNKALCLVAFRRDRGVCAICGLNTERIRRVVDTLRRLGRRDRIARAGRLIMGWSRRALRWRNSYDADETNFDLIQLWQADHIVPLAEGGADVIGNLRTLCLVCHPKETGRLQRRLHQRKACAS